jgi:hypothetical protein
MSMDEPNETVTRVMVPVWTDAWMSGDQYGTVMPRTNVKRLRADISRVRMDKSGRLLRFRTADLTRIGGW